MVVLVVVAHRVRVIGQLPRQPVRHRLVRRALHAGVEGDPGLGQSRPGPAADAAADQRLHPVGRQKARQRPVAAAVGIHHPAGRHGTVFDLIELELSGVPKMLEHLAVLIGYRENHVATPHFQNRARSPILVLYPSFSPVSSRRHLRMELF